MSFIGHFHSCTLSDKSIRPTCKQYPYFSKFKIIKVYTNKKYILAKINYKDSLNFNGDKIILFKGISPKKLYKMEEIDPHFLESNNIIARFIPTKEGWNMGMNLIEILTNLA